MVEFTRYSSLPDLTLLLSFVPVVSTCDAPANITGAAYTPEQASYIDGESVTYACSTGYTHSAGSLTLNCVTGSWDATPPTCTSKALPYIIAVCIRKYYMYLFRNIYNQTANIICY